MDRNFEQRPRHHEDIISSAKQEEAPKQPSKPEMIIARLLHNKDAFSKLSDSNKDVRALHLENAASRVNDKLNEEEMPEFVRLLMVGALQKNHTFWTPKRQEIALELLPPVLRKALPQNKIKARSLKDMYLNEINKLEEREDLHYRLDLLLDLGEVIAPYFPKGDTQKNIESKFKSLGKPSYALDRVTLMIGSKYDYSWDLGEEIIEEIKEEPPVYPRAEVEFKDQAVKQILLTGVKSASAAVEKLKEKGIDVDEIYIYHAEERLRKRGFTQGLGHTKATLVDTRRDTLEEGYEEKFKSLGNKEIADKLNEINPEFEATPQKVQFDKKRRGL